MVRPAVGSFFSATVAASRPPLISTGTAGGMYGPARVTSRSAKRARMSAARVAGLNVPSKVDVPLAPSTAVDFRRTGRCTGHVVSSTCRVSVVNSARCGGETLPSTMVAGPSTVRRCMAAAPARHVRSAIFATTLGCSTNGCAWSRRRRKYPATISPFTRTAGPSVTATASVAPSRPRSTVIGEARAMYGLRSERSALARVTVAFAPRGAGVTVPRTSSVAPSGRPMESWTLAGGPEG